MLTYISIIVTAIFINNIVFSQFLGICPFLGVSKKTSSALGMGAAVTFVITLATVVTWLLQRFVLDPLELGYLQTIAFILVIAFLVQMLEIIMKKIAPSLYSALGVFLPLITTNCAVLGVAINNITDGYNFIESMVSSLGCGLGFLLAMVLFSGLRSKIDESKVPVHFRGLAVTLIAASFISLAFMGLAGIVDSLFA